MRFPLRVYPRVLPIPSGFRGVPESLLKTIPTFTLYLLLVSHPLLYPAILVDMPGLTAETTQKQPPANGVIVTTVGMSSPNLPTCFTLAQFWRWIGHIWAVLLKGMVLTTLPTVILGKRCFPGFLAFGESLPHFLAVIPGDTLFRYVTQLVTPSTWTGTCMYDVTILTALIRRVLFALVTRPGVFRLSSPTSFTPLCQMSGFITNDTGTISTFYGSLEV